MPFYEYQCRRCGHHHEALQKISDAPLKKCPECGKSALQRLVSAPVFRLKGGGWYETDFKSDAERKRNLHGEAEAKGAGKDEASGKTEATGKEGAKDTAAAAPSTEAAPAKPASKPATRPVKATRARAAKKAAPRKPAARKR